MASYVGGLANENLAASLRLVAVTDDRVLLAAIRSSCWSWRCGEGYAGAASAQGRDAGRAPRAGADGLVREVPVPVIVNDRLDVALAAGAAGVHLGADDFPVDRARRIAPTGFVIGASVGTPTEAAEAEAADYWGIGPWRATGTKADAGPALGEEGFARFGSAGRRAAPPSRSERSAPKTCRSSGGRAAPAWPWCRASSARVTPPPRPAAISPAKRRLGRLVTCSLVQPGNSSTT